jgi:hypothetical protein
VPKPQSNVEAACAEEADIEVVRATIKFTKRTRRLQPNLHDKESRDEEEAEEQR